MRLVTRFLKGLFNFFVGDWIILTGVAFTLLLVALVENLAGLAGLKDIAGVILVLGVALTLGVTLRRETTR